MFMRYFGGGIGHSGNLIRDATTSDSVRDGLEQADVREEPDTSEPAGVREVDAALERESRQVFTGEDDAASSDDGDDEQEPDMDLDEDDTAGDDPQVQDEDGEDFGEGDLGPDDGEDSGGEDMGYGDY